jgi:gliding motility-associated protein GldL
MASGISPATNKLVNIIVCVGAAIVIVGALFKIQHWKGSEYLLPIGLLTEAFIFLVYAFLPPPDAGHVEAKPATTIKAPEIDWDTFKTDLSKMSGNFQKLGTTVNQMTELGDVVKSTGDFGNKAKEAAVALGNVSGAVTQTTANLSSLNAASENVKQFHSQVQVLTKNLSSLNTIYELELQESNNHLKALNQFYGKLAQASAAMNASADDAMKAKEQIGALATNLGKLNQVYGNMLSAMQVGR